MRAGATRPPARAELAPIKLRGTALAPVRPFVEQTFGVGEWPRFLSLIGEEPRALFAQPITPLGWYPFSAARDVVDGLVTLADGRARVLREFAAFNLDVATNVIFRAIFKLGSPEFMVARSDQVWKRFYSHGRMTCEVSPGHATVALHDFPYLTANYNRLVGHSIEAVLNKAGARSVRTTQNDRTLAGDSRSEFSFEWK